MPFTSNFIEFQISIPVAGSKKSGVLKSCASVRNGKWELDSVSFHHNDKSVDLRTD